MTDADMKCAEGCTCGRHRELAERSQFKGAEAAARTRHQRVERRRGKASEHQCVRCPAQALDWAQVHNTDGQDPWADYVPLCRRCHRAYDQIGLRQRGVVRNPHHDARGRFARVAAVLMVLGGMLFLPALAPAQASSYNPGAAALNWAEANATGHWYGWGGTGPAVYDCSGLVYASVAHADGFWLPRTTYGMLAGSAHLYYIPLSAVRRGDLLFYGSGHVEFATMWYHVSFGAQQSGTQVGWHTWSGWWAPTMAMRIR